MATLRELTNVQDRLASGHRMCAGCGAPMVAKWVLKAIKPKDEAVVGCATGCLEVSTGLYPYSSDRKSTRLNSSHANISYAVFCLKKKQQTKSHLACLSDRRAAAEDRPAGPRDRARPGELQTSEENQSQL